MLKLFYEKFAPRIPDNVAMFWLVSHLYNRFARSKLRIANSTTNVCIEAYPSSGNTFFQYVMHYLFPDTVFAHHTHSIGNIKLAIMNRNSVFVIIRHPVDAISSKVVRFGGSVESELDKYIKFYSYISRIKDKVTVLLFEDIISSELQTALSRVVEGGLHGDIDPNSIQNATTYAKAAIERKEGGTHYVALPSNMKDANKTAIKQRIEQHDRLTQAIKLYDELCDSWRREACK